MKKLTLLKTIFAIFAVIVMTIGLNSCSKKSCEKNNTADVVVTNNSGYVLHVDVVYNSDDVNDDRTLEKGQSTTYTVTAGTVYIQASNPIDYASKPIQFWAEENYSNGSSNGTKLTQCQVYNKSWTTENTTTGKGSNGSVQK